MKLRLLIILGLMAPPGFAYELGGMENSLGHGAAGYAGTVLAYGFIKRLVFQERKPRLEDKIFLIAMSSILNFGVAMIKEASDDSRCKASTGKGCLDMGAVGYGMLGVAAAGASIIVLDF